MPGTYASTTDAVRAMMDCLWYEAKAAMSSPIDAPDEPYLHPVDVDTDEPGIVASRDKADAIRRRRLPLPRVVYTGSTAAARAKARPPRIAVPPPKTLDEALRDAEADQKATHKKAQTRARQDSRAEERSMQRMEAAAERKRQRDAETPEERAQRLLEQRAKREDKKRQREEEAKERAARDEDEGARDDEDEGARDDKARDDGGAPANADGGAADAERAVVVDLHELLEEDCAAVPSMHGLIPPRVKARGAKVQYYCSPVPFDRHLTALERAQPHARLEPALLRAEPSERLIVVSGPPGTGKTSAIVDEYLPRFAKERVLLCAPTNVGAANVYTRVIARHPDAALLLPPSRVPAGTPCTTQDPGARIVCSTVSGRSGRLLDDEAFGVVIVDEAAQCMEAWLWSLLRPEVHTLIMIGDVQQLPATVSAEGATLGHDVSLMDRLVRLGYPTQPLSVQRRMHPEIVRFPNETFYGGKLRTEYAQHLEGRDAVPPYQVVQVDGECKRVGTSSCNPVEAAACLAIARELEAVFERVVILCPYQAQTRELLRLKGKHVHTIDSFQGQEADAIVISVVRREEIGFWSDTRRLNVALTRARHCLRVVGACNAWQGPLRALSEDAARRGCHCVWTE